MPYSLNLPRQLQQEAEHWAATQGISLDQFILWAIAEKVGEFKQQLYDPVFPRITYKRTASGQPVPVLRDTNIRVQTIVVAAREWQLSPTRIAAEYDVDESQVNEALAFYQVHRWEVDVALGAEQALEASHG
jgi:uncharacterized protein (DUF433 family)